MFKRVCFVFWVFWSTMGSAQLLTQDLGTVDGAMLVEELREVIVREYVLEENIDKISEALQALNNDASYVHAENNEVLADLLTQTLKPFDRHFTVRLNTPSDNSDDSDEGYFDALARRHSGFRRAEILDGNIGYLVLDGFDQLNARSRKRLVSAMAMLEETQAMIVDLRNNGGGSPDMVAELASYFFAKPTHLNTVYDRQADRHIEFWTARSIEGKKRPEIPVYVLTSAATFSAAEEFSYDMQSQKRATVVGEVTGGGAHPIRSVVLMDLFVAHIPFAKAINPITKTNWEGVGVQPDVAVPRDQALNHAHHLALKRLSQNTLSVPEQQEIEQTLQALATDLKPK